MGDEAGPPLWLWKGTLLALAAALAGGLGLAAVIALGSNNPRPAVPQAQQLPDTLVLEVASPDERTVHFFDRSTGPFVLEAVVTLLEGEDPVGFGLAFRGQALERYGVFAVGPDGYMAVLRVEGGAETPLLPWQQFPHIRQGRAANRLRMACAEGECQFWVNDERAASLPDELGPAGDLGLWARRYSREDVRVQFAQVSIWEGR